MYDPRIGNNAIGAYAPYIVLILYPHKN